MSEETKATVAGSLTLAHIIATLPEAIQDAKADVRGGMAHPSRPAPTPEDTLALYRTFLAALDEAPDGQAG